MARRKNVSEYVSPVVRARDIVARADRGEGAGLSPNCVWAARRILVLAREHAPSSALEAEEAPWAVWRWVAWGSTPLLRRQRAELAVHLRRTIDTAYGGWVRTSPLQAAWDVWQGAIRVAKARGLYQPHPADMPCDVLRGAVDGASSGRRSQRRSPREVASPPAALPPPSTPVLTEAQRALLRPLLEELLRAG